MSDRITCWLFRSKLLLERHLNRKSTSFSSHLLLASRRRTVPASVYLMKIIPPIHQAAEYSPCVARRATRSLGASYSTSATRTDGNKTWIISHCFNNSHSRPETIHFSQPVFIYVPAHEERTFLAFRMCFEKPAYRTASGFIFGRAFVVPALKTSMSATALSRPLV